jgi:hypothetical protein
MCWSLEVSTITGSVSYAIAAYLWLRNYANDRWHSLFILVFSSIQWMDAGIWLANLTHQLDSSIVMMISKYLIPLILSLEPIAALAGASYVGKSVSTMDWVIYGLSFFIWLIILVTSARTTNIIQSNGIQYTQGNNHSIYWLFCLMLLYPFLKYGPFNQFYLITVILVASSLFFAQKKTNWCLYGNLFAILALFYPYLS